LDGLPGISTNLLSERLKCLEEEDILCRRVLPPPAGSAVYELTPAGQALETAMLELGRWGSRRLPASLEGIALPSLGAIALALQAFFHPEQAQGIDETYELRFGAEALQVRVNDAALQVRQGPGAEPAAVFHTDMQSFLRLFTGLVQPDEAVARGLVRVEGDSGALMRFLRMCQVPGPPARVASPPGYPPLELIASTT
jgi:hypothetical protein